MKAFRKVLFLKSVINSRLHYLMLMRIVRKHKAWISLFVFLVLTGTVLLVAPWRESAEVSEKQVPASNPLLIEFRSMAEELVYVDPHRARELAKKGLEFADAEGDNIKEAIFSHLIGNTYLYQGRNEEALAFFHRYLELALQENNPVHTGNAYGSLGLAYSSVRNYKDAVDLLHKSARIHEQNQQYRNASITLNNLGRIYFNIDDLENAFDYFRQAYSLAYHNEHDLALMAISNHLGMYYQKKNMPDSALHYFDDALAYASNNNYGQIIIHNNIGDFHLEMLNFEDAVHHYELSDSLSTEHQYVTTDCFPQAGLANAYHRMGDIESAYKHAKRAYTRAAVTENDDLYHIAHETLAGIYHSKGDFLGAYEHHKAATGIRARIYEESEFFQVYRVEIESLSEQMEVTQLEVEQQELLLSRRQNAIILIVIASFSLLAMLSLLYYSYLQRMKQKQKEKLHESRIRYTMEKNFAVMEAETSERKRLASDLHDGIGTQLSLVKLTLSNILNKKNLEGEKRDLLLSNTVHHINEVINEVRQISNTMTPITLAEKGFKEAVKELVSRYKRLKSHTIALSISGVQDTIKPFIEHAIYRTMQEIINNALKHADCTQIDIQIIQNKDEFTLMIEDDGKGFDTQQVTNNKGFGLKQATSRIEGLNGQLYIDSMPGRGTIVTISLPLNNAINETAG